MIVILIKGGKVDISMNDTLKIILNKIKPGVPKRILFFLASVVWGFASSRILRIGVNDITDYSSAYWINYAIGIIGCYFFFRYVFFKMYKKHTKRIVNMEIEKPCMFSFFDFKGFGIMAFMITGGITLRRSNIIPAAYMGTFYITLGLSLLLAAVSFLYAGFRYEFIVSKYLNKVVIETE